MSSISKPMCKTVKCKHSLPSHSHHHLPQPETISALAAAIMRSSWKSNKGLQGEQLYTSVIPLGCYGMFFHQTTVCQALAQIEKALTCLWLAQIHLLLAGKNSDDNFELFSIFVLAAVLTGWISGHFTVSHTVCWQFPIGWLFQLWLIFSLSHIKHSNRVRDQWVNTQCSCQGGPVSWFYSFNGKNKKLITQLVCQMLLDKLPVPPPLSNIWA